MSPSPCRSQQRSGCRAASLRHSSQYFGVTEPANPSWWSARAEAFELAGHRAHHARRRSSKHERAAGGSEVSEKMKAVLGALKSQGLPTRPRTANLTSSSWEQPPFPSPTHAGVDAARRGPSAGSGLETTGKSLPPSAPPTPSRSPAQSRSVGTTLSAAVQRAQTGLGIQSRSMIPALASKSARQSGEDARPARRSSRL